ncbi:MAG: TetR/AcrR family transcriptional regulator [Solirubrobacterales bacterium]|nr:TetR/AcrR family transcriptional regulator [Solirubrobacterales bacterium]
MPTRPRREPRQARSRDMVERIVEGAIRVLVSDGYHEASTNRIARQAGVSPGSVYQYFANKEEIVDAISVRMIAATALEMEPALRESAALPPTEAVPKVLGAALDSLQARSGLLRAMVDYLPADEQRRNLSGLSARLADRVHAGLAATGESSLEEAERRTWMIVEVCQSLLVRYVLDEPGFGREEFLGDLSTLVIELAGVGEADG